ALFNIGAAMRITGPLQVEVLKTSLNKALMRHDALRTVIKERTGKGFQRLLPEVSLAFQLIVLPGSMNQEEAIRQHTEEELGAAFAISEVPPVRFRLLALSGNEWVLIATMHHVIADAATMQILLQEVVGLYSSTLQKTDSSSPPSAVKF